MVKRRGPEINHFMPHSTQGCTGCCNLAAISVNQFTLPNPKGVSILQNPLLDRDSVDKGTLRAVEIGDHNRLFTPRQQAVVPGDGTVVNLNSLEGSLPIETRSRAIGMIAPVSGPVTASSLGFIAWAPGEALRPGIGPC